MKGKNTNLNAPHDHTLCISHALEHASAVCAKRGVRLTQLRSKILSLVWQNHSPLGAYQLMEMLQKSSARKKVAPPTVYRALDFLQEQGLVYKLHSLNAYIGSAHSSDNQPSTFLVCGECGFTEEIHNKAIQQTINLLASQQRFSVTDQVIEVLGVCVRCRPQSRGNNLGGNQSGKGLGEH